MSINLQINPQGGEVPHETVLILWLVIDRPSLVEILCRFAVSSGVKEPCHTWKSVFYTGPSHLFTALTFFLPVFPYLSHFPSLRRGNIDVPFVAVHSYVIYSLYFASCECLQSLSTSGKRTFSDHSWWQHYSMGINFYLGGNLTSTSCPFSKTIPISQLRPTNSPAMDFTWFYSTRYEYFLMEQTLHLIRKQLIIPIKGFPLFYQWIHLAW